MIGRLRLSWLSARIWLANLRVEHSYRRHANVWHTHTLQLRYEHLCNLRARLAHQLGVAL